ncbi:hypothetical protein NC652_018228 [Populus alba x Populus x berolinensis]|nr:hypothetical protein NC651_016389 [Populus alba x Populus x berolinensis]KAJ6923410.1 hypothetical protein NC652_016904 [Populus alba x Populus x berolinensis]KAJ6925219.1 hypothetical protein NC652_018228 [Populus alba x Populus x berolinensis]
MYQTINILLVHKRKQQTNLINKIYRFRS